MAYIIDQEQEPCYRSERAGRPSSEGENLRRAGAWEEPDHEFPWILRRERDLTCSRCGASQEIGKDWLGFLQLHSLCQKED